MTMRQASVIRVPSSLVGVVQRAWEEILKVDRVAPDEDFFDLGGHSLLVPSAVALLGERVGIELTSRSLFEAPTPAEMAELIVELREATASPPPVTTTPLTPNWVVTLRQGGGRPVFVFPGGLGGKWILQRDARIAGLVGGDRPFYGFRRDPESMPHGDRSVPAMAAAYIARMRVLQDRGPYLLYGICSGGALAWETAAQLLAAGESVAGMLFFESPLRTTQIGITPAVRSARSDLPGLVPAYAPEPLPVDLTLLMTEAWHARGQSDGWPLVTQGRLGRVLMPGDSPGAHNLYAGREATIASHVRDWIAQAEEGWRSP
jgi:hypothetical protein